jgi:hypothetical protein
MIETIWKLILNKLKKDVNIFDPIIFNFLIQSNVFILTYYHFILFIFVFNYSKIVFYIVLKKMNKIFFLNKIFSSLFLIRNN